MLEFMRDYDKLRSGRIPLTSFRRALDLCGFDLSPPEVTALEHRSAGGGVATGDSMLCWITNYCTRPPDAESSNFHCTPCRFLSPKAPGCVDYRRFSDEVESIFTRKHLEKTPTAAVLQFVPPVQVRA